MSKANLVMTLGKVMIAAAWADGEISLEETNSLKDLLFRLPELNAKEWAELEIYMDSEVDAQERARLVEELQHEISSKSDQQLALATLEELVAADGQITDEESRVLDEIRDAIEDADTGLINVFSKVMRAPLKRSQDAVQNREAYLEDFIKNRVYYGVRRRLDLSDDELDIPEDKLRKLSLAGGLMGHVAHVDDHIDEAEFNTIVESFQNHWNLRTTEATFVAEAATSQSIASLDYFRTAREFFDLCTHDELIHFIEVLFEVAASDGMATQVEIEEIRLISRSLLVAHEDFIKAKLTVPRENREV